MPSRWVPTDRLFQARLRDVIYDRGIERTARQQGVSTRTVRNWAAGRTTPSAARRVSVARAGLRASGEPVIRGRDATGRFNQEFDIVDSRSTTGIRRLQRERRVEREIMIEEATTERQRQEAETIPADVTWSEMQSYDNLMERSRNLEEQSGIHGETGEEGWYWSEWDESWYEDDWDSFRSDYEQMAG